jgi:uncharacterized protein (TIGR03118 family)
LHLGWQVIVVQYPQSQQGHTANNQFQQPAWPNAQSAILTFTSLLTDGETMKFDPANNLHHRRLLLQWGSVAVLGTGVVAAVMACGGSDAPAPAPVAPPAAAPAANRYTQANLVANNASYQAKFTEADFIDAWGIAIRPKGAGGHFWVGGGGTSWQYVGDVTASSTASLQPLFQDGLKKVTVAGADSLTTDASLGKITGVVYNGAPLIGTPATATNFRITGQKAGSGATATTFDGSARFVFVTDSGKVSGWTDRSSTGTIVRIDGAAQEKYDGAADGSAFFGVAIKPDTWDTMWLADFGANPQIVTLDKTWAKVPTIGFANPFGTGAAGAGGIKAVVPGDPVPFNIQVLGEGAAARVFVAYAISQPNPDASAPPGSFYAAEEDALDAAAELASGNQPNKGKLVEFNLKGERVRIFDDAKRLNAPWGVALAPDNFGKLSGALLVGNFGGAGRICAFDASTGQYIDDLRDAADKPVAIAGLWGLQFGNGESLGDSNALYFAAGPADEKDGLFGSLRYAAP